MTPTIVINISILIAIYIVGIPFFAGFADGQGGEEIIGLFWPLWVPLWLLTQVGNFIYKVGVECKRDLYGKN